MKSFFYRHRYKFIVAVVCLVLLVTLSGCRTSANAWYSKPYTTYGQEWKDLWDGGSGFWQSLWGWPINILSYPFAALCSAIGKGLGNSYFWGIFFLTIIVRTIAWPIYARTNSTSMKMQQMQPEMQRIQQKYANRRDPRSQQQMQQETAKLYKKYKISPLGCIIPMLFQFPIFMSMYEVVQRINATATSTVNGITMVYRGEFALHNTKVFGFFEMNTSFFNASSGWDKAFGLIVALLFIGLQILQQKLAQRPSKWQKKYPNDKAKKQGNQMKWVMLIMNVVFGFMALSNTTLGIYWLIGAVYQIFQSEVTRMYNNHKYEKEKKNPEIL